MSYFVNARAIRHWADLIPARYALPQVLRRLVYATAKQLSQLDFPAYESAQRSGFDGQIECEAGNAWIPDGRSVWEFGVNQDVKGKADDDFKKRTDETPAAERSLATYVAVTPRHWEHKEAWATEQRNSGQWKDVRAYDADDLEQWSETVPSVAAWFGRLLGKRPDGVDDIDAKWEMLSGSTTRVLLPSIFLGSRDKELEKLKTWTSSEPSVLSIKTRSPAEGVDFFAAYVASLDEKDRDALASRCIVIETGDAWKALRDAPTPAILVVEPSVNLTPEEFARAVRNGHHVLVASELWRGSSENILELKPAKQFELIKALRSCGYSPADSEQKARASAGSLAILKRQLAKYPASFDPAWSETCRPEPIRASLLLGGWDDRNVADQQAVERLAGISLSDLEPLFHQLSKNRDPLLLHADKKWRVISMDEAWATFANRITAANLVEFERIAIEVLADDDPRFDMEGDKRHLAQIMGQVPRYSKTIKEHVAKTLAMLGALGDTFDVAADVNIAATVSRIVSKLLPPNVPWQRWASLGSYLPMLAEASPSSFLSAVKRDLGQPQPEILQLLEDEGGGLFGHCNHAGLLWALESLAWSKQYLTDVCLILLALHARDPGEKWSNRPRNSLAEILSVWIPQTTASAAERIQVLDRMIERDPVAAWPVLLELLPGARHVSTPTHKPYWRNWATDWKEGATNMEYRDFALAVGDRVLTLCTQGADRLVQVINQLGDVPSPLLKRLIDIIGGFAQTSVDDTQRRAVAESLNTQISWYRRRDEDHSAIEEPILIELEGLLPLVQPRFIVQRHAWLFEAYPTHFYSEDDGVEAADKKLEDARRAAINEIVEHMGFDGVHALASLSASPDTVGRFVANVTEDLFLHDCLAVHLSQNEKIRHFAGEFFASRFHRGGWDWGDRVLSRCESAEGKALLLATFSLSPEAWTRAEHAGNETRARYWNLCRSRNSALSADEIDFASRQFLQYRRVTAAVELLQSALYAKKNVSSDVLCETLEAMLSLSPEEAKSGARQDLGHTIGNIVTVLQDRNDIDELRLAKLEMSLIDVLDGPHSGSPRTLQRLLTTHPELYADALAYCFPQRDENDDPVEWTESDLRKQQVYYKLLHCLDHLPGQDQSGTVNEDALRTWCTQLRRLAAEGGRLELCDSYIGQLMVHAPADTDGSWPAAPVRRVLEEIQSEDLADGICMGIHNERGVVWRGADGSQERELAAKYQTFAEQIRFTAPFVAAVLDTVAESYEHEGRTWDEHGKWEER